MVRDVPEADHLMTEIGGTSFWESSCTHVADLRLTLKDKEQRTRSTQQIAAAIRQSLPSMPGVLVRTRAGGNRMFRMGQDSEDRLSVEVRGYSIRDGSELAGQVKTVMEGTPGW